MTKFKELFENKGFVLYDKTTLRKTLQKNKGGYLVINPEDGRWEVDLRSYDPGSSKSGFLYYSISDLRDYFGWRYNIGTSITHAIKDIEKGSFDMSEVGR